MCGRQILCSARKNALFTAGRGTIKEKGGFMMDFHTTAVFFSPTGGTRRALECFLNQWDPQAVRVDATCPPVRLEPVSLATTFS